MTKITRRYISIPALEVGVERLFSRGRDQLRLRRYILYLGTIKILTILKAFYSDKVFCKALVDLDDEAIKEDVKVVIQGPGISKKS